MWRLHSMCLHDASQLSVTQLSTQTSCVHACRVAACAWLVSGALAFCSACVFTAVLGLELTHYEHAHTIAMAVWVLYGVISFCTSCLVLSILGLEISEGISMHMLPMFGQCLELRPHSPDFGTFHRDCVRRMQSWPTVGTGTLFLKRAAVSIMRRILVPSFVARGNLGWLSMFSQQDMMQARCEEMEGYECEEVTGVIMSERK